MALTKISTGGVKDDAASQAKIADEAVDEARLQVSNAGSNGQFLQKQSGNTGGLTWAAANQYTHPNHSGEVTSTADGAQVIASDVVDEDNLKISNSGTNGQFLQKQSGNTGGLTWADVTVPPAGNTVDLVADGAIAAGKPVIVTTAGKAAQIATQINARSSTASSSIHENNKPDRDHTHYALAFDTSKDRVVLATSRYANVANISTGIGTATVSLGSDFQFSVGGKQPALIYDPDVGDTWLAYRDENDGNKGRIRGLVIGGTGNTTLSNVTGAYTFHTGHTDTVRLVYDTNADKLVILYRDSQTKYYTAIVATVGSNQSLTFGSEVSTGVYGDEGKMDAAYDATANRVVICMADDSDSNKGKYVVGTVSGNSISFSSKAQFNSGEVSYIRMAYHAGQGKVLVSYKDHAGSNFLQHKAGTTGSSDVTWGSGFNFPGNYTNGVNVISVCPKTNIISTQLIADNNDKMFYASYTLSGTTFTSLGSGQQSSHNHSTSWENMVSVPMGNHARIVVLNYNSSASRPGLYVYDTGTTGSNATASNVIGFAENAINDTATGTIKLTGNVVGNQSGLTAGTAYYIQSDGSLGTSQDNTLGAASGRTKAGVALSATTLKIADYA